MYCFCKGKSTAVPCNNVGVGKWGHIKLYENIRLQKIDTFCSKLHRKLSIHTVLKYAWFGKEYSVQGQKSILQ